MDRSARMMRLNTASERGSNNNFNVEHVLELVMRLALVAVFIWAVVMLVNYLVKYLSSHATNEAIEPVLIAKQRLARGEITKIEFDELKKELK